MPRRKHLRLPQRDRGGSVEIYLYRDCISKCFGNQFCYSLRYDEGRHDTCAMYYFSAYNCTHQTLVQARTIEYKGVPVTIDCLRCPNNGEFITAPPVDFVGEQTLDAMHQLDNKGLDRKGKEEEEETAETVRVHRPSEKIDTTTVEPLSTTTEAANSETVTSQIVMIHTEPTTEGEASTTPSTTEDAEEHPNQPTATPHSLHFDPIDCDGEIAYYGTTNVDFETVQLLINETTADTAAECAKKCFSAGCG
ncbi:unnamed protein product, partial [Mesorhabditis spiculigera]